MGSPAPAEPPPGSTVPGRYRYGCAVAVTIALSLVLCCGLSLVQWLVPSQPPPPQTSPVPAPFAGSVLLGLDRVTVSFPLVDPGCRHRSVRPSQDDQRVVLYASYTPSDLVECDRAAGALQIFTIRLGAPLGSRSIVDGVTGAVIPYFDQRTALRPRLPIPDWPTTPASPYGVVSMNAQDFGGPGSAVLVESFLRHGPANGQPYDDRLQIIQVTGGGWSPPPSTARTPVIVRGRPGRAAAGIVVWSEGDHTLAVQAETYPRPLLSTDQLVAIAATLVPGEDQ